MNIYGDDERSWLYSGNFRFDRLDLVMRYGNPDEWHYFEALQRDDWLIHVERVEPENLDGSKINWMSFSVFLVSRVGETTVTILFHNAQATSELCSNLSKIGCFAFENEHNIKYAYLRDTPFDVYSAELIKEWRLNEY